MQIQQISIHEIVPYENNARFNDEAVDYVKNSIKEFGFQQPIVVDKDNVIIAGHTRYKAAREIGMKTVPTIVADDLTEEQVKAYRLADNKTGEIAEWDFDKLLIELKDLELNSELDMADFGFLEQDETKTMAEKIKENPMNSNLFDTFLVPPFSVLDTTRSLWLERKNLWKNIGIKSELGRDDELTFSKNLTSESLSGTSIFDPVLTELIYRWFMPDEDKGTNVVDPFAGGSVRGIVAAMFKKNYTGIDLRKEQIEANYNNAEELGFGGQINWINDNSLNIDEHVQDESQDLLIACPPYLDLEVYSDNPDDLSNMDTDDFFEVYKEILKKAMKKLKDNRFAVIVVSDVRGKDGMYRDLTGETKQAMIESGAGFYNDIILLNSVGSGAMRARKTMAQRKTTRRHQNVLVFFKGNQKNIKNDFTPISDIEDALANYSEE